MKTNLACALLTVAALGHAGPSAAATTFEDFAARAERNRSVLALRRQAGRGQAETCNVILSVVVAHSV